MVQASTQPSNTAKEEAGEGAVPFESFGNGGRGRSEDAGLDACGPWLPWAAPHATQQPAPIWIPARATGTLSKSCLLYTSPSPRD